VFGVKLLYAVAWMIGMHILYQVEDLTLWVCHFFVFPTNDLHYGNLIYDEDMKVVDVSYIPYSACKSLDYKSEEGINIHK
jgi:hypothetical protein